MLQVSAEQCQRLMAVFPVLLREIKICHILYGEQCKEDYADILSGTRP